MRPVLFLAAASLLVQTERAHACSPVDDQHHLDVQHASDTTAPSAVTTGVVQITREDDEDENGCGPIAGCGPTSTVRIEVAATDDATPVDRMGYQLRAIGGDMPEGFYVPPEAIVPIGTMSLYLHFSNHDKSAVDFDLEIRAVDLNGNLGPATVLHVSDPGEGGGCSSRRTAPASLFVLLALASVLRRRRR
jgi:hypothetical protein